MKVPFLDLRFQYENLEATIKKALDSIFKRGWFILGQEVEAFEKEFARYCGARYAVGVGSGTEALALALEACGLKRGDEVITVANTAFATVAAIIRAGGVPIFTDIDPKTYTMAVQDIESCINPRTRFILPVHLFGFPADMKEICRLAKRYRLNIIEDAAQAHGASYQGKKVGTFGDAGCFSFYPSKNLGAYGDGGAVVVNSRSLYKKLKLLRNYGQEKRYWHNVVGFNSRLDEIQAAFLRIKLRKLEGWNRKRRIIAGMYNRYLNSTRYILPSADNRVVPAYHLYVIRTRNRDELRAFLKKRGVGTEIHYPVPIHKQRAYLDLGLKKVKLPVTERYSREIISLPIYPELEPDTVKKISQLINAFSR